MLTSTSGSACMLDKQHGKHVWVRCTQWMELCERLGLWPGLQGPHLRLLHHALLPTEAITHFMARNPRTGP